MAGLEAGARFRRFAAEAVGGASVDDLCGAGSEDLADAVEEEAPVKESNYSIGNAITSSYTWIPVFSLIAFGLAFSCCVNDKFLSWIQRNSFIVVLLTLVPLGIAIVTSSAGKGVGRALFTRTVDELWRSGFARATLWVLDTNTRARRFYAAAGWSPDGAIKLEERPGFVMRELRYGISVPAGRADKSPVLPDIDAA